MRRNRLHNPLVHLVDAAAGVDHHDPVPGDNRDLLVGLGDGALQVEALGLEAVVALGPAEADLGLDLQQQGQVRQRPSITVSVSESTWLVPSPRAPPW